MEFEDIPLFQAATEDQISRRPKSKTTYDIYGISPIASILPTLIQKHVMETQIIENRIMGLFSLDIRFLPEPPPDTNLMKLKKIWDRMRRR